MFIPILCRFGLAHWIDETSITQKGKKQLLECFVEPQHRLLLTILLQLGMLAEEGFHAPLDLVDGAARVYDPIVRGEAGEDLFGVFLKDYSPGSW